MSAAQTHMDTVETAFALAKILREEGYLSETLEIAQAGLNLPGNYIYDFAAWTSDLAQGLGHTSIALNASIIAFEAEPSFREYTKVQHLAGEIWEEVKQDLLEILRDSENWCASEAKVDIFLHEGLIDDAIKTVKTDSYYRSESVHRVMQAALPHRPDWVINNAKNRAEGIMNQGKADPSGKRSASLRERQFGGTETDTANWTHRYEEAVNWLKKVKAGYLQLGQQAEWSEYRASLEYTHGRKRKLIGLFNELN